ncbi:hypothetical protein [Ornithinibacillus contaminans]|uniref:hypothetical protein n=1 Tax=Ornithinibacillus contaminans TaxID=694055 RepID=UPI00064DE9D3|nr:hypothetical protein [Ornithinibacillus contaminans]
MERLVTLYLASILAGFALTLVPTSAIITAQVADFLNIIGGIVIVVFAVALLHLGLKALFTRHLNNN